MFRFAPFFLANALFRICAFALIIVFLDWWSVIPFSLLLFLNLVKLITIGIIIRVSFHNFKTWHHQVVFGLSFRRFTSTSSPPASEHASLSAIELNRLSTMEVGPSKSQPSWLKVV